MYWVLAYVTGGIIILISLFNFIFPSRKISLILKASLDFTVVLNLLFAMLATNDSGLLAGMITTAIGVFRDIIFIFRDKNKFFDSDLWPIGLCVIFGCSLIFTYKSPISILPVIGSLFSTTSLYSRNPKSIKIGALMSTALYDVYYIILIPSSNVLTIFSLISSTAAFIGALIGLIVLLRKQKENDKQIS